MLKLELVQDTIILNICMIKNQNRSKTKGTSGMTKFFFNCYCDHGLDPITLKSDLIRGIIIPNTCVKLYRNWIINKGTRVMTIFF